ncbi:MAG: polyphosphate kinase 2 family protein [Acidobacteriota bacterium]|nr:polyphosphate kinase 2 family protein [Acidobacteriota bacterium]
MSNRMQTKSFQARPGKRFRLEDFDPADTGKYKSEPQAQAKLQENVQRLATYQDLLYADRSYALLVILQAMDAAGKDGTVKHVMSGVNPAGCSVCSFKQPSQQELDHDFLWRSWRDLAGCGRIGIFNRSYYEEVLVVRVHPELLANEHLPSLKKPDEKFWEHRFQSINDVERHLVRNGTVILKFFLHLSKDEQKRRLLARLDDPEKNWKFSEADLHERLLWDDYMHAYEDMINHTSTRHAPWYIVPADHKWFAHLTVSDIIVDTLKKMDLKYPSVTAEQKAQLTEARKVLEKK